MLNIIDECFAIGRDEGKGIGEAENETPFKYTARNL